MYVGGACICIQCNRNICLTYVELRVIQHALAIVLEKERTLLSLFTRFRAESAPSSSLDHERFHEPTQRLSDRVHASDASSYLFSSNLTTPRLFALATLVLDADGALRQGRAFDSTGITGSFW